MSVLPIPSSFQVGHRFQADDSKGPKGFIRFVGSVESKGKTANYVGVEWDLAGRGTHDGVLESHRYFTCPLGQGSFIHPQRVNVGIALTSAVDHFKMLSILLILGPRSLPIHSGK